MFAMKINTGLKFFYKMKKVYLIKNKKSLSAVIATVLLILLVVVSTAIVWTFVNRTIKDRMNQVDNCFDVESSDKVSLDGYYTCHNVTYGEVQFSLKIKDVEIDEILISISSEGSSKSIVLTDEEQIMNNVRYYKGEFGKNVKLPGKNEGQTYSASGFTGISKIDWIKISPVINKEQCRVTSTISEIENCNLLVN